MSFLINFINILLLSEILVYVVEVASDNTSHACL